PSLQGRDDGIHVVDAAAPGAAADALQRGPQARIVRQRLVRRQIGALWTRGEHAGAFLSSKLILSVANQVDASLQPVPVNDDADPVSVADAADRAASERFRTNMTDAGAGRDAGKASVGDHR